MAQFEPFGRMNGRSPTRMPLAFAAFADLCRRLEATRSRLTKRQLAADFLRELGRDEIPWAVAFLTARPFPAADPRVLDVSWGMLAETIDSVGGVPARAATLTLKDVAHAFEAVAAMRGPGSRQRKAEMVVALFGRATPAERDIVARIVHGEMRLGLHDGLILDAIAAAAGVDVRMVRRARLLLSDPSVVASIALAGGKTALEAVEIRLFVPHFPMLAEPIGDVEAALAAQGGRTALEFKYDGARIQLHKGAGEVRIWSRRLAEVTASLPDIVRIGRDELPADSCILDGEVVATAEDGRPLPFQELMRRFRRVHAVETLARELPLALRLFDCLWLDGRSFVDDPYEARWAALKRATGSRHLAWQIVVEDPVVGQGFYHEALAAGHEGLIAKALESPYTPGTRGRRWLKIKRTETVDCVIVAADRGSGRRRGWLSNYHLAVRDPAGRFAPVGKTFKGLSDHEFGEMTARLRSLAVADDGYTVTVRPEVVVEVAYSEIQQSRQYRSGLALRFARISRMREDKAPAQATTLAELRTLFDRQSAGERRPRAAGCPETS